MERRVSGPKRFGTVRTTYANVGQAKVGPCKRLREIVAKVANETQSQMEATSQKVAQKVCPLSKLVPSKSKALSLSQSNLSLIFLPFRSVHLHFRLERKRWQKDEYLSLTYLLHRAHSYLSGPLSDNAKVVAHNKQRKANERKVLNGLSL